MNDNTESTGPLYEPLDDHDYIGDNVTQAAQLLKDVGVDIYALIPDLEYLVRVASRRPHHVLTEAEMEDLIDDEELEAIRELNMRKMFDLMCGSDPCEHPEHND